MIKIARILAITLISLLHHYGYAINDNIGMKFEETFIGHICIGERIPQECDSRMATDKLSIYFYLSKPSANRFFNDLDLNMDFKATLYWNDEEYSSDNGLFTIDDQAETTKQIFYYYQFKYRDKENNHYQIDIQKTFFQNESHENMWGDLTTMYVTRKQIFPNNITLPAGAGIIKLPRNLFTISEWITNFKSTNGTFQDDLDIRMMALNYFIFDRFNKVYNGHPMF